jgi:outer membrane protein OmpA-like peptidoglycan-associated protein
VARLVGQYDRAVVTIAGHTDGSMRGKVPQQAVAQLSRERANAVKQALVAKYKFDPNKFTVEGRGWDQPADAAAPDNHALNRRVEVSVYPVESGG